MRVPIEISARHVHLTKKNLEILFGNGYRLNVLRMLSQPGQFAAKETVNLKNGNKELKNVRIIGPCRNYSQIEISKTDDYFLSINAPVRISGDIQNTPGICIIGPKGKLITKNGVIIANRHLHLSKEEAKKFKLKDMQTIKTRIVGKRALIFDNIVVRSRPNIDKLSLQIDPDEANAASVKNGDYGEIL